ncbi:hypothetical protein [Reyranella sp.]|jgi:hypothetical protein|uniref:hypothetical protein n=1 Tax=Reyranella sp. TaxID=1929291 RepID=UPI000BD31EE7|nr:hypothetical protein [Reyranella sp.]OYY37213.1 MAG: hypothetical protein B7Y57_23460 [Rhodospirillales bacterium 35-66-84]OYZ94185.1 MAG: hypothetical protein B7Y08_13695 [Rhodospirillales bacterium 24-66-33]HQS17202.1 hypothetical protein [Reyranella sp.]HQT13727.1 hypothetical protein [Reyranella sp.]
MWLTASVWGNALLIAAAGAALVMAAAFGRAVGESPAGNRLLRWSPLGVAFVVVAYVGVALVTTPRTPPESCIYSSEHPSGCQEGVASPSRGPSI